MTVVSNAGPLIALARIEKTKFLPQLYGDIVIPPAVREQVIGTDKERKGQKRSRVRSGCIRCRFQTRWLLLCWISSFVPVFAWVRTCTGRF
jgi:hypothetical protein